MTLKDVKVIEDLLCKILIWSLNFHFFVIYSALFFTHEVLLSIRYRVHVQWSWTKILSQKWRWQQSSLKCFPSYFLLYRGLWDVVQMDMTVVTFFGHLSIIVNYDQNDCRYNMAWQLNHKDWTWCVPIQSYIYRYQQKSSPSRVKTVLKVMNLVYTTMLMYL